MTHCHEAGANWRREATGDHVAPGRATRTEGTAFEYMVSQDASIHSARPETAVRAPVAGESPGADLPSTPPRGQLCAHPWCAGTGSRHVTLGTRGCSFSLCHGNAGAAFLRHGRGPVGCVPALPLAQSPAPCRCSGRVQSLPFGGASGERPSLSREPEAAGVRGWLRRMERAGSLGGQSSVKPRATRNVFCEGPAR